MHHLLASLKIRLGGLAFLTSSLLLAAQPPLRAGDFSLALSSGFMRLPVATVEAPASAAQSKVLLDQIQAALDRNDDRPALVLADQAVARFAASSEAFRLRAVAKRKLGDLAGALADASKAIELDPANARAWNGRSITRGLMGDIPGALPDVDKSLVLDPQYHQGFDSRAAFRVKLNDLTGALADSNRAIEINGSAANYWIRRGQIKRLLHDLPGAEADLTRGLALKPGDAFALTQRAGLRLEQNRWDEAIADASQVLASSPANAAELYRLRSEAYRRKGATELARQDDEQVRRLTPTQTFDASTSTTRDRGKVAAARPAQPAAGAKPVSAPPPAASTKPVSASAPASPPSLPESDVEPIALPPRLDPAVLGQTVWAGQSAVALEAMRALMGPLSPEETKRFETMWAAHIQQPSEETEAYFAEVNPKLQEMLSLRGALGQATFEMQSSWQEAVMAAGYGAEPAAEEALAVVKSHSRTIQGLHKRMQAVAQEIERKGPPPDPTKARQAAKQRHIEAAKVARRLLQPAAQQTAAPAPVPSGDWVLVRVEKKTNMWLKASDTWGGDERSQSMGAFERVTTASLNASDGQLSSTALWETKRNDSGKNTGQTYPSDARISWTPPPKLAKAGTVWKPTIDETHSENGWPMLMKNVGITIEGLPTNPAGDYRSGGRYRFFNFVFPPATSLPAQMIVKVDARGTSGSATFTYVYEAGTAAAAASAPPEEIEIPDDYPAEGRVAELAEEIRFTAGSVERLRAELGKETNPDRRKVLDDQILQAETSIQRDRDLIASIQTGQAVFTRTAWDDRASALLVQQMKAEVNKMADLQRNQDATQRMIKALTRFADKNPAEATEMKAFIQRQLVESGAAAKGDLTKARAVAQAVANKVLGTFEGESAKQEEQAAAWDEYTHYAKTIQTMSTTVVGTAMAEVGVVLMAPVWMARAGSALYAGSTGYIATGSPVEAVKEAVGWSHPIAAVGVQLVSGYQEGGAEGAAKGFVQGLAIGWLMHQSTQAATATAGKYNYRFTPPKPTGGVPFTIKDFTESKEFRQAATAGKSKVRAFEEAQQELKAYANAGADPGTLKRMQDQVNTRANVILEDPHAKFFLLKSGQASPQTKRLFSLHHETTHLKVQQRFEKIMTEEMGFNPQKHQPVRNATSEGTAGMDYDLALVEHPAFVKDAKGNLVPNHWLTRNGQPASVAQYQDAASRAYRRAFRDATGLDANKAWENVITSVNTEAYKDVGAARPSVADPDSFLHPEAGSGKFGGWLDTRNPDNVAALKKVWARQAGDVTEVKGWEFTNPEALAWKGMSKLEGMHEAVRGTAKDVDKLLVLVNQSLGRAQGADAKNLLAARNHWQRIQETMTDYSQGRIGPISFRHKLHQMTGRTTVNEVIADLGGGMEVMPTLPPK